MPARLHKDGTHLILRDADPLPHRCVVSHGELAHDDDRGMIIQCRCGRRYRCRERYFWDDINIWVRRWLPWPTKQEWP